MSIAHQLIESVCEGAHVTKRKGEKHDAYGWSGNVPDLIWSVETSGRSGGEIVWFLDANGEGADMNASLLDQETDQYIARPTGPVDNEAQAERAAQVMIKAINAAVAKSDADNFIKTLEKMTPPGWQVIG